MSLNFIEDGTLKFRTLREIPLKVLLSNAKQLCSDIQCSSEWVDRDGKHPFVLWRLKSKDALTINNFILNNISEQSWFGYIASDAGVPSIAVDFCFGLTVDPATPSRPIRYYPSTIRFPLVPRHCHHRWRRYRHRHQQHRAPSMYPLLPLMCSQPHLLPQTHFPVRSHPRHLLP